MPSKIKLFVRASATLAVLMALLSCAAKGPAAAPTGSAGALPAARGAADVCVAEGAPCAAKGSSCCAGLICAGARESLCITRY